MYNVKCAQVTKLLDDEPLIVIPVSRAFARIADATKVILTLFLILNTLQTENRSSLFLVPAQSRVVPMPVQKRTIIPQTRVLIENSGIIKPFAALFEVDPGDPPLPLPLPPEPRVAVLDG